VVLLKPFSIIRLTPFVPPSETDFFHQSDLWFILLQVPVGDKVGQRQEERDLEHPFQTSRARSE